MVRLPLSILFWHQNRHNGPKHRRGLTLIELLVSCTIVGVLLALVLPAIQQVRETARRAQCTSQLRQIGLGLSMYIDAVGRFPLNELTPWPIAIAPQVDRTDLFARYDHRHDAFGSVANAELGREVYRLLRCPSDRMNHVEPEQWIASGAMINAALHNASRAICSDGLSCTAMISEVPTHESLAWITGPERYRGELESAHGNAVHILWGDGSVRAVRPNISVFELNAIWTPNGGESVAVP